MADPPRSGKVLGRLLTPMITPFDDELDIDFAGAIHLASALVGEGADGMVLGDVTGEGPTLSDDERADLVRQVKRSVPDAAVVGSVPAEDTRRSIELAKRLAAAGADAVVSPVPAAVSQSGVAQHYEMLARFAGVPVLMRNSRVRTGAAMSAGSVLVTINRPGMAGVWDGSGNLAQLSLLCGADSGASDSPRQVWAGDECLLLPALAVGAYGLVSLVSHLAPRAVRALIDDVLAGDLARARERHARLLPLSLALDSSMTNPAPLKAALRWLGLPSGPHRPPVGFLPAVETDRVIGLVSEVRDLVTLAGAHQPAQVVDGG